MCGPVTTLLVVLLAVLIVIVAAIITDSEIERKKHELVIAALNREVRILRLEVRDAEKVEVSMRNVKQDVEARRKYPTEKDIVVDETWADLVKDMHEKQGLIDANIPDSSEYEQRYRAAFDVALDKVIAEGRV